MGSFVNPIGNPSPAMVLTNNLQNSIKINTPFPGKYRKPLLSSIVIKKYFQGCTFAFKSLNKILSNFLVCWPCKGCLNKHGNSVTSMSSFQIILWFSKVRPTEKAVNCKSFVCYVHILFMFWLHTVVISKTR